MNSGWNIKNRRTILWCLWFSSYLLNRLLYIQKNLITCFWKLCFLICNMLPLTPGHWELCTIRGRFYQNNSAARTVCAVCALMKITWEFRDNIFLLQHRSKCGFCGEKMMILSIGTIMRQKKIPSLSISQTRQ